MKIAVASKDGLAISEHFGRSASFIVFEINDGRISNREVRPNTFTHHALGLCTGEDDKNHHDQPHSHAAIVSALHDCEVVLCYGMGYRAATELAANGIKAFIITQKMSPEEAIAAHLKGDLQTAGGFCGCHEGSNKNHEAL